MEGPGLESRPEVAVPSAPGWRTPYVVGCGQGCVGCIPIRERHMTGPLTGGQTRRPGASVVVDGCLGRREEQGHEGLASPGVGRPTRESGGPVDLPGNPAREGPGIDASYNGEAHWQGPLKRACRTSFWAFHRLEAGEGIAGALVKRRWRRFA